MSKKKPQPKSLLNIFLRVLLTDEQIDLWIIHVFGFLFDLTCGFFLLLDRTRPMAIIFSTSFHLMNSRMFHIGQFPYVCLVTTPIFCSYSWPKQFWKFSEPEKNNEKSGYPNWKEKFVTVLLAVYMAIQLFLPYSHSLTQVRIFRIRMKNYKFFEGI